ncbi:tetratricopeptide repeat protein [Paraburkholderia sp. GAS448]|uniref:tetratricopeptide repeat protein n=1 Tax=Paraburkholderia sp. GAS448 TaxID=3035136 RepID=UPI003D21CA3F
MSSVQRQGRRTGWQELPRSRGTAGNRNSWKFMEHILKGLRAAGWIGRGPSTLWPYVRPWVFGILTIAFFCFVAQGVFKRHLLVRPVETPPSLIESGYTSNFLAQRVMSAMQEIGRDAGSIPHDDMMANDSQPDIQIPGQEMSYASTVRFLKGFVGREDVVVNIGITRLDGNPDSYVAHVRIEGGLFDSREDVVFFTGRDLDKFVPEVAAKAMQLAEPNILASHLFTQAQKKKCSPAECDYHEIVGIYDEVLALPASQQSEWALAGKAWLLTRQDRSRDAEEQSRDALLTYPHSAVLQAALGVALEQQHRIDDAIVALRQGAQEKSKTAENLRLLGDVLLHAHRYPEALDAFEDAWRMNPYSVDTLHDWGEAFVAVRRYDDAIDRLSRAVALRPDLAPSYVEWGRALEQKGDLAAAARRYAQASRLDKQAVSPHEENIARLAREYRELGRSDRPVPDTKARSRSNPSEQVLFEASLGSDGWSAMLMG